MITQSQTHIASRALEQGGCIPDEVLAKSATPAMFYSAEQVRRNLDSYVRSLAGCASEFRYAVKACPLMPVLREVARAGWGADCQSRMEVDLALRAGVEANLMSICSPRLSMSDVVWCMSNGIQINVDSESQLHMIQAALQRIIPREDWTFGVRLSLPVADTARFHSKLGMEVSAAIQCLSTMPADLLQYCCEVHHHGLAREDGAETSEMIAESMVSAVREIEAVLGIRVKRVNFGGGLESDDLVRQAGSSTAAILRTIWDVVNKSLDWTDRKIVLEPGRAIVKNAAVAVTSVINLKNLRDKNIAVVDLSTNMLIPLPLAEFRAQPINGGDSYRKVEYQIVDGTCSPAGVICRDAMLPQLKESDRLLISHVGGYTVSLAEPFYDYLPDIWWVDKDVPPERIFDRQSAVQVMNLVYCAR